MQRLNIKCVDIGNNVTQAIGNAQQFRNSPRDALVMSDYDPQQYAHLDVPPEVAFGVLILNKHYESVQIQDLFQMITVYEAQTIEVEPLLQPFIPEYIPAVGDIDAFVKVPRPDDHDDQLGMCRGDLEIT